MSTSISGRMSTEIQDEVSRLLGRGRTTFECPLDAKERQKLWHGMFDPAVLQAVQLLRTHEYEMSFHETIDAAFDTNLEGEPYTIGLYNWTGSHATCPQLLQSYGDRYRSPDQLVAAFPQPVEDWPAFVQWVQNTGRIEKDFTEALETLTHLLGFCNTIGQLTRAVPELAQYLTREKREVLQGQKRSSNMPYEWATFDRKRIDILQFSLAKAHLLPVKHNLPWGNINGSRAVLKEF